MRNQIRLPGLNRRLVMERDHGRVRELLLVVSLSGLMLMPLLFYVWQNVEWIRIGYRVERLQDRHDRLVELNQKLMLERATLEGLSRVERVATERLGMAPPPDGTVVMLIRVAEPVGGDSRDAQIRQAD
jgi:cell division protein FtsL